MGLASFARNAALVALAFVFPLTVYGAGEGNRTLVVSLEGFCSTIELHPLDQLLLKAAISAAGDSNLCMPHAWMLVEEVGFEPT